MKTAYPACFFQEDAGYSVVFPDLGYLATCSDSLAGAFSAAVDCLAGYLHAAPPSDLRAMDPARIARELGAEPSESFVHMVTVDAEDYACIHFKKSI